MINPKLQKLSIGIRSCVVFITDLMAIIGAVVLAAVVLLVTISVILRYVFNIAVGWSTELTELAIYIIVMLGSPWVLKIGGHISLDFIVDNLNPQYKRIVHKITNIIGTICCLGFCYFGTTVAYKSYIDGHLIAAILTIPKYVIIIFIPVMFLLCFYYFLCELWKTPGQES